MSAAQRDKLFFEEEKEDASFRRELTDLFKQSNDNFLKAMDRFNKTVSQLGNALCRSTDILARAMYMSNQATQNQNVFFQIIFSMFIPLFLRISLRMFLFQDQKVMQVMQNGLTGVRFKKTEQFKIF